MQLALRVIAILSFVVAIIWWFVSPGFEPLSAVLVGLLTFLTSFVVEKSNKETESLDQRNRRVMLNHVENFWVKGILEKSLHGAALLELGIKEDLNAINYPWAIKKESTNETLPAGKSMLEIFEEIGAGRSLLILGAPGSGKTTMLLELARQLIRRARNDETEPIPVVFNLASWTEKQPLANWLAEQLNIEYRVPKKTAPKWIGENKILLLLDGLDEVRHASRTKCVEAINQFRTEQGLTSLVICSRIEEYQPIKTKLSLEGAITIQPLTSKQVNDYFEIFGESLAEVKRLLNTDKTLRELTETPLMLSIMTLAYKDKKPEELPNSKDVEEGRRHVFNAYINRMFERPTRTAKTNFNKTQTLHSLSWLARKMVEHNIINYQIESMQPSWLEDDKQRRLYKWIVVLSFGLILGLIGGLIGGLILGLILGLIGGLMFGLSESIVMVDKLRWSWKNARGGLLGGLLVELIGGLIYGLIVGLDFGLSAGLSAGLFVGLFVGLILGLIGGLTGEQIAETNYPGQRINRTLHNSIFVGLIFGLIVGLFVGLILGLIGGLDFGLSNGLVFGLIGTLNFGFDTLIRHYTLRNILVKGGTLPRSLISFLDHAVDLIFLRRVGGSYIFIHRLLMEHFAEMEVEKP